MDLERNWQQSCTVFTLMRGETWQDLHIFDTQQTVCYQYNLDNMTQQNLSTGRIRQLKRYRTYNWTPSGGREFIMSGAF